MKKLPLAAIAALMFAATSFAQTVIRVDRDAPGAVQDGLAWSTAYLDLNAAIASLGGCPPPAEIWIAEGLYKPAFSSGEAASFTIFDGTSLYGGFLGFDVNGLGVGGETSVATREGRASRTILSGDRNGLGRPDPTGNTHVVRVVAFASAFNPEVNVIDGLRIQHGYADDFGVFDLQGRTGGGINIGSSVARHSVRLRNLIITENVAMEAGAGIYSRGSMDIEMTNCTVERNAVLGTVSFGGGPAGFGGGLIIYDESGNSLEDSVAIYNSRFIANTAPFGAAVSLQGFTPFGPSGGTGSFFMGNCLLTGNTSTQEQGAFYLGNNNGRASEVTIHHCTIADNAGGGAFPG